MEDAFVCYGDCVLLLAEEFGGVLMGLGFADERCFVQNLDLDDFQFTPNNRCAVFQIIPKLSYENEKELRRMQTSSPLLARAPRKQTVFRASDATEKEELDKLVNLSQRVEAEDDANERTIAQRMGESVRYGHEIQLRHVSSQHFLRHTYSNADLDKSCTKLCLSSSCGLSLSFRVESRFRYKQDGDRLIYGDFAFLCNTKSALYLHVSEKSDDYASESAPTNNRMGRVMDFLPSPGDFAKTFEVNLSTLKSVWRPYLYAKAPFDPSHLYSGEVIKLIHTEKSGLLASDGVDYTRDGISEVYILHRDSEDPYQSVSSSALFVLEANTEGPYGAACGFRYSGKPQTYRLRHLTSNRVVVVNPAKEGAEIMLARHSFELDSTEKEQVAMRSLFSFTPTTSVALTSFLPSDSVVKITSFEHSLYLSTSQEPVSHRKATTSLLTDDQTDLDSQFFVPIDGEETLNVRYKVTISESNVDEDAYHLCRADPDEVREVEFLKSSLNFLYIYGNLLRDGREPLRSQMYKMTELLTKLIFFVIEADGEDPLLCEGEPKTRRQVFLREIGVIDLIGRVLTYSFDTGVYSLSSLTQTDPIIRICALSYRLLKHASANNSTNEMYCAQWIGLFLNHLQRTQAATNIRVEETLTEILRENQQLLEHFVTPKMIAKFVELIRTRKRDSKYMKLLSVLCLANGQPITSNQNAISETVLNDSRNRSAVLMRTKIESDQIAIEVTEYSQWLNLQTLEEWSERNDSGRVYRYFLSLLDMVAALAYGRNHHADVLREIYTFEVCFRGAESPSLAHELRSGFLRVLLHLHIDQGDIHKLSLPNNARILGDLSPSNRFPRTDGFLPIELERVKKFLRSFFIELNGELHRAQVQRNQLVADALTLTLFLVEYGLYISEEEVSEIIDPLVRLLNGTSDDTMDNAGKQAAVELVGFSKHKTRLYGDISGDSVQQSERYQPKEGRHLLMHCKEIVCQILLSVTLLRLDLKISIFLYSFRDSRAHKTFQDFSESPDVSERQLIEESVDSLIPERFDVRKKLGSRDWVEDVLQESTLDVASCTSTNLIAVLLDLLLYKHPGLVNSAFRLLLTLHTQRQSLLQSLLAVQLLESEDAIRALAVLNDNLSRIKRLAEDAEFWLGRQYSPGYINPSVTEQYSTDDSAAAAHDTFCEAVFALTRLSYLAKHGSSGVFIEKTEAGGTFRDVFGPLYRTIAESEDAKAIDPAIFGESEEPIVEFQTLLRNMRVYEPILEVLKHPATEQFYCVARHQRVLRFCFVFLAKFCRENEENQEMLSSEVDCFIEAMPTSVFATTLIQEIYHDNSHLCLHVPVRTLRSLCKAIGETPLSKKKCAATRLLSNFVKVNGNLLRQNQAEVMSQLTSYETENFKGLYDSSDSLDEFRSLCRSPSPAALELLYFQEMLRVMSLCCESKNAQAETTCQLLLPLTKLRELVLAASEFWPVKEALITFFLHVYLDIEYSIQEDDDAVWGIILELASDLDKIYDNLSQHVRTPAFELLEGTVESSACAFSYAFLAVIPAMREIVMKRGANLPQKWSLETLGKTVKKISELHELNSAGDLRRESAEFLMLVWGIDKLEKYVSEVSLVALQHWRTLPLKSISPTKSHLHPLSRASDLSALASSLLSSPFYQALIDDEFNSLVLSCMSLDKITETAFGPDFVINPWDLFQSLVYLIDVNDINLEDSLLEQGLKVLRKSIELEVAGLRTCAAEWDTDDWVHFEPAISERQNKLAEFGAPRLICAMISLKSNETIREESILLGIALLLGGNREAQNGFLECMQRDVGNHFLTALKLMLIDAFEKTRIAEQRRLRQNHRSFIPALDTSRTSTLDGSSSESDTEIVVDYAMPCTFLTNILRFLQLLCEGHFGPMQDHLREQQIGGVLLGKSFDFVLHISGYLGQYIKFIHIDNVKLGFQMIDTLTEVVQGPCRGNQRILSQPRSIEQARDLLLCLRLPEDRKARGFTTPAANELISTLKSKTANFLLSLLEGDPDIEITKHISDSLDFAMCRRRMLEVFRSFIVDKLGLEWSSSVLSGIDHRLVRDSFEGAIEEGFNLYILMSKLVDDYPLGVAKMGNFQSSEELMAFTFFKTHTARIEVVIDGHLQRTYFPIQPICRYISDESKDSLMLLVNRDSAASKVSGLLAMSDDLIEEMNHNYWLSQKRFRFNSDGVLFLRKLCLICAVLINYVMLFKYDFNNEVQNELPAEYVVLIDIVGIVLLVISGVIVVVWCVLRAKLVIVKAWKQRVAEHISMEMATGSYEEAVFQREVTARSLPVSAAIRLLLMRGPTHPVFNRGGRRDLGHFPTYFVYYFICLKMILENGTFQYFCLYILFNLMGLWDVFFYSFLLLDVMYMFPTLHNVIQALTVNGNQIVMTSLLGVVLIYLYAFWAFYIDPTMFYDSTIGSFGESLCQSLWECTLTTMNNVSVR